MWALSLWWGRAMLDSDPDRDRIHAAAEAGTLPTATLDSVRQRRQDGAGRARGV